MLQFLWGKVVPIACCVLILRSRKLQLDKTHKELFFLVQSHSLHIYMCLDPLFMYTTTNQTKGNWLVIMKNALFLVMTTRLKVIIVINHPPARSLFLVMSRLWRLLIQSSWTMIPLMSITLATHLFVWCLHYFQLRISIICRLF